MSPGRIDGAVRGVGIVGGTKKDIDEGWFDVGFFGNSIEDILCLIDIKGGNFINNASEDLKFFFEVLV